MRRRSAIVSTHAAALASRISDGLTLLFVRCSGQGLVEYGLILVMIMVVCVGILALMGTTVSEVWYDKLINNGAWD